MRLPADQRRAQLLEVARDRFADLGFHATSMDEIAEAAGVTKPVLYQHFPSKRALYCELLDDTGRQLLERIAESAGTQSGRAAVESGFRAYFEFAATNRQGFRLLLQTAVQDDDDFSRAVTAIVQSIIDSIAVLLADIFDEEQRMVLAAAIFGMAESVSRQTLWGGANTAIDPDRLARWISELAWFGMRGIRIEGAAVTD
jgi:AcrR family transcriptional regulator